MTLDTYEQSLLTELRRHVAERSTTPERRRVRRRWWIAAPVGVAGAVAAFLALAPSAAYAVVEDDGDIVVTVHRLDDAEGLERALAEHGIAAEVEYDPAPVPPLPDGGRPDTAAGGGGEQGLETGDGPDKGLDEWSEGEEPSGGPVIETALSTDGFTLRIYGGELPDDAVLHITTSGSLDDGVAGLQLDVVESD